MTLYAKNRGYAILEKMTEAYENIIRTRRPGPTKAS